MQPSRVGSYTIERKIGSGGMGTVYYGRHVETGRVAAVKVLAASLAGEEGFVARFNREAEALKQLHNPHIVELYESGVDAETYFFAMEYVDGETLTKRLRRDRRLSWQQVIEFAVQVCRALKAAHDTGIIHRDLKPSNLLITADGQLKLTDFGVAQVFAATKLTSTGGIIGTAEYMSPEQAKGQRANKKSDLYSLGAVMYVMLTGRPPFTGKTTLDVLHKHQYGQFDQPSSYVPEIPHWLDEIVCQLLAKDPDDRFPDAYVVSRRLQEVVAKVKLSQEEVTQAAPGDSAQTDETVAIGSDEAPQKRPGMHGATLMRDLVREHTRQEAAGSFVGRLLESTWFLVTLLILLIVGGVIWFQQKQMSPEERFEAGLALMQQPPGPEWLKARDEYFEPLLEQNAAKWQERIEGHLRRIQIYELRKEMGIKQRLRRDEVPPSEPVRFLKLANSYWEMGDLDRAESTLIAVKRLLKGRPEDATLYKLTQQLLRQVQTRQEARDGRKAFLESSLERASRMAEEGRTAEAHKIYTSLIELYGSDPRAAQYVHRAREALKKQNGQR